jgi:hypothetical protein
MAKYLSKVVEVEAWEIPDADDTIGCPAWVIQYSLHGFINATGDLGNVQVHGVNGITEGAPGDYIINRGGRDIYVCKREVFHKKYEV